MDLRSYAGIVLHIIRTKSIFAERFQEWDRLKAELLEKAACKNDISQIHDLIRWVLHKRIGDRHSFFLTRKEFEKSLQGERPLPSGQYEDGVAYLNLPYHLQSEAALSQCYASRINSLIAEYDRVDTQGWVVDLRGNGGGNVWPMITGLGPLLGNGVLGYLKNDREPKWACQAFRHQDGSSWLGNRLYFKLEEKPHVLKNTDCPVAVLTGDGTGSAGEVVAIAFIGNSNACRFGEKTNGLTTTNYPYRLPQKGMLIVSVGFYANRFGEELKGPIEPEKPVAGEAVLTVAKNWIHTFRK